MKVVTARQVEKAKRVEDWGTLRWVASKPIAGINGLTLGRVVIKKGKANPPHRHPNCDELLLLTKGKLRHVVGRKSFTLNAGDTLVIPKNAVHWAKSTGRTDAEMIVAYNSGRREFKLA